MSKTMTGIESPMIFRRLNIIFVSKQWNIHRYRGLIRQKGFFDIKKPYKLEKNDWKIRIFGQVTCFTAF